MSDQFFLKKDNSNVHYKVDVHVAVGNASSVPRLRRSGNSAKNLDPSSPAKNGSIAKRLLGKSDELAGSVLVIDTAVLIDGVPDSQLDQIFETMRITYTLFGGVDGDQEYELTSKQKGQFMDKKLIVASKAIKLVTH